MSLLAALTPVVEVFERNGISYLIGGSVASSTHGVPRSTNDVDVVADLVEAHVEALHAALCASFYVDRQLLLDAIRRRSCVNWIHLATGYKVDVFVCPDAAYDRLALQRGIERRLSESPSGRTFRMATPEDVVLRKLLWYRAGGEVSDRQWSDVLGLLRLRGGDLDREYLDEGAPRVGIADLLARARTQA
jgi:hypothetical protein